YMPDVERHIALIRGDEYHRFFEGMRKAKLIQHIRITSGEFGHQHSGAVYSRPNLVDDLARPKYISVGAHGYNSRFFDRGFIDAGVVSTQGRSEWHHYETGIARLHCKALTYFLQLLLRNCATAFDVRRMRNVDDSFFLSNFLKQACLL